MIHVTALFKQSINSVVMHCESIIYDENETKSIRTEIQWKRTHKHTIQFYVIGCIFQSINIVRTLIVKYCKIMMKKKVRNKESKGNI